MQQIEELTNLSPVHEAVAPALPKRGFRMNTVTLILIATALGVGGQFMLKYGMGQMGPLEVSLSGVPQLIWKIATAPYVIGGLMIYGIGTFFWLVTLSRIELSVAYPFVSLNHVLIFLIAWLVMREQVSPLRAAGVGVICVGMLLVARS